jgi:DNA-binding transcriptional ArsR family regulator
MGVSIAVQPKRIDEPTRIDAVFRALASPQRRAVLRVLAEAERRTASAETGSSRGAASLDGPYCCPAEECACHISQRLDLAPSTVSHHMHRLLDAGLVSSRKKGQWVYYRLERTALEEAARAIRAP